MNIQEDQNIMLKKKMAIIRVYLYNIINYYFNLILSDHSV